MDINEKIVIAPGLTIGVFDAMGDSNALAKALGTAHVKYLSGPWTQVLFHVEEGEERLRHEAVLDGGASIRQRIFKALQKRFDEVFPSQVVVKKIDFYERHDLAASTIVCNADNQRRLVHG